ncbi:MAG: M14 family zinc carboxypeptidase, partial [Planctomycetota bacterium]
AFFRRPYVERSGNERPIDDDRDGQQDEDGPDDLNGDGWITMMRVADPTGPYMSHSDDARVMIKADPQRDQRGRYSLYVEGRDNDEDDQQGEDPAGGVALNRNFTFRYPYFEGGAGPHQVSEVETRAVADFAFSHRNVAAVLTFTPEDNLMRPWKPDDSEESKRIKTAVLSADAPYFDFVAEQYQKIHGGKDPPESPQGRGSLSEWAYFHYGRWSFACRGWWIPEVKSEEEKDKAKPSDEESSEKKSSEEDPSDEESADKESAEEERGTEDLNALRWFAREKIDAFVDWKPIVHPDFPKRKVEVGGFKPFLRLNPPADQLEPLAERHWRFVRRLVKLLPRVVIQETKVEPLGEGVWRVTAVVANRGYLPTESEMGRISRVPQPLQIQLDLPEGLSLVTGHPRAQLPPLAGRGGKAERTWLVRAPRDKPAPLKLRVWSPSVGTKRKTIKLAKPKKTEGGNS